MSVSRFFLFLAVAVLLVPVSILFGTSQAVPAAKTGAPGEGLCTECHTGTANSKGGGVTLEFSSYGSYASLIPQLVTLRVNPGQGGAAIGFQVAAKLDNGSQAGTLVPFAFSLATVQTASGIQYLSHTRASADTAYHFQWIAPPSGSGNVRFSVAAVAGVNDGAATAADATYTASYSITPDTRPSPDGYRWDTVSVVGAMNLQLLSIANDGRALGNYVQNGVKRAFIRAANGAINPIAGDPVKMNAAGTVIEANRITGADGSVRTVSVTGAQTVTLLDINDSGFVLGKADANYFIQSPAGAQQMLAAANVPATLRGFNNAVAYYGENPLFPLGAVPPQGALYAINGSPISVAGCGYANLVAFALPGVNSYGDAVSRCDATVQHVPFGSVSLLMRSGGGYTLGRSGQFQAAKGLAEVRGVNDNLQVIGRDVGGAEVLLTPCAGSPKTLSMTVSGDGGTYSLPMNGADGCRFDLLLPYWITMPSMEIASGALQFTAAANLGTGPRTDTIVFRGATLTITQPVASCPNYPSPSNVTAPASGGQITITVTTNPGCAWTPSSDASWATVPQFLAPMVGSGSFVVTLSANAATDVGRTTTIRIGANTVSVYQRANYVAFGVGLRFVPMTPCRVMDTRPEGGKTGSLGPPRLAIRTTRTVQVRQSGCGVPSTAQAYSFNVTAVPPGYLGYLTLWPAGQQQPFVSTLNSWDGRVVANAAITAAGTNGDVNVYVSNDSDVVMDINGYFVSASAPEGLAFYPVTPCRVADTRPSEGKPQPFGPPSVAMQTSRTFPVPASSCGIPTSARAYSLNVTAVPKGYLGFITLYPNGQARPFVSTLNSWDGSVVANAAIVPAGADGGIAVYASNDTDMVLDINGYFAPATNPGSTNYFVGTPCRLIDTRNGAMPAGFGPPSLAANAEREFSFSNSVSGCSIFLATAAVLNVTVVPPGPLAYLSVWPSGGARPLVSTLNAFTGQVTANMAIVPLGFQDGLRFYAFNSTDLVVDAMGYFAPF